MGEPVRHCQNYKKGGAGRSRKKGGNFESRAGEKIRGQGRLIIWGGRHAESFSFWSGEREKETGALRFHTLKGKETKMRGDRAKKNQDQA